MVEENRAGHTMAALALMFNALVWGLSWWPFRQLQSMGLHPLWATSLIYAFALVCVLALRANAWRAIVQQPQLAWLMLASGLTNVCFNWAVSVGDVVRVVLLFYLMPAWSVLLAWMVLSEKPTRGALARLVLALGGVLVVLKTPGAPWPVPASLPDWLGLMGGASFALNNVMLRKLKSTPPESRMLAMFTGGALLAAAVAWLGAQNAVVPWPSGLAAWWPLALALALIFLCSNMALQFGAARLRAHTTALIMLSEVVFASLSAVLLDAALLEWRTLLGGGMIVAAAVWAAAE
jgi:drug/metabolite transporter (DMT)-like permease